MNGACFLGIDVDPQRIQRRVETGYCDRMARNARRSPRACCARREARGSALSVGLVGNCADVIPELARRGIVPDVLTDQTSAHDPLNGYVPNRHDAGRSARPAHARSRGVHRALDRGHGRARGRHAGAAKGGRRHLRLRQQHPHAGRQSRASTDAFDIPGFVPEYIRPLFCEGRGPFRWVALSGDPEDIYRTDRLALEMFPERRNAGPLDPAWRASGSSFRDCPRASAGWVTASAPSSGWP